MSRQHACYIAVTVFIALAIVLEPGVGGVRAGIVSPRGGGKLPDAYVRQKLDDKNAFTLRHAWIGKQRIPYAVEGSSSRLLHELPVDLLSIARTLSGRLPIPVILGRYVDILDPPAIAGDLQRELFDGPWDPGTLSEFYEEASLGHLEVTGTVYDWIPLDYTEVYYTGGIYQGLYPGRSRTGEMIQELLDALDPSVDFGLYDNDGPDDIPNSGDDDGFVDVLIIVHPTVGAECRNSFNMWSHSWLYSEWPASGGNPYATDDPASGGGSIRIEDYIVAPSVSCEGGLIEIGVYCHEIGHVLGMPDLYDYNGGSSGIGHWGLMGAGNWNTPESPAHFCAWTMEQMGWIVPVTVDWRPRSLTLPPVHQGGIVVKMPLPTRRFRWLGGREALVCGYTGAEAQARDWPGDEGYGNLWHESMIREFHYDASRPVTLEYDVSVYAESDYDYARILLERGTMVDTIAEYTGGLQLHEVIDIGSLLPSGAGDFVLRLLFSSDFNYSDEDGYYDSNRDHAFLVDNVSVTGGGLDYFSDFGEDAGGWRGGSEPAEYFIIENRRRTGFDRHLPGQGMLIWHAESSTAYSILGNSGGFSNIQARGLVLEEADGDYDLLIPENLGGNMGDSGDPFTGASGKISFGPTTVPSSQSNSAVATPVTITGIDADGTSIAATFKGGMPQPVILSVEPTSVDTEVETSFTLDVRGEFMQYGADCYLAIGRDTVRAEDVSWLGEGRVIADFTTGELFAGQWDVAVVGGDGQTATAEAALEIISIYLSVLVTEDRDHIDLEWALKDIAGVRGCLVYRSTDLGEFELLSPDTLRSETGSYGFQDQAVEAGSDYSYRIVTFINGDEEKEITLRGPYSLDLPFFVEQNYPNPFSERTNISFYVPATSTVTIDIYDVAGRRVGGMGTEQYGRGKYTRAWIPDRNRIGTGIYFCVIKAGTATAVKKLVLVR
ncbi:MAG: M6 family metalloprotease domain-containing protein [bacterium]|nr:MAG: M6 family metalloprotease domain-containing protein [bacterium]